MSVEKQFEELGQKVVGKASSIRCSTSEYINGLEIILEDIQAALGAAKEDLKLQEKG